MPGSRPDLRHLLIAGVAAVASPLAWVPPARLRAIPWRRARSMSLRLLNQVLMRRPRDFVVACADGQKIKGNTRDIIQRYVYVFGEWEPNLTAWLRSNLPRGSVVVDVGANVGYFTLLTSRLVGPEGRVISVEALPSTVRHLEANVELNGMPNVEVKPFALGDREGHVEAFRAESTNVGASSVGSGTHSEGWVPMMKLDDAVTMRDAQRVGFIKIDVEGAEEAVLSGARQTLANVPSGSAILVEARSRTSDASGFDWLEEYFPPQRFEVAVVPNSYSARSYCERTLEEPVAVERAELGVRQADLLFVRR